MPPYPKGCLVKTVTHARDINANDLRVIALPPAPNGLNWNVTFKVETKPVSDVAEFVQVITSAQLNHSNVPGPILVGPITAGAPGQLNMTFNNIALVTANTGNKWYITLNNLQIVGKGGQTVTAAVPVVLQVDSPF
jgi:hypothetical protein